MPYTPNVTRSKMEANTHSPAVKSRASAPPPSVEADQSTIAGPAHGERFRAPSRALGAIGVIRRWPSAALLCGLSLLATSLMFPPVNWSWLGYFCLVPWLVCVCTTSSGRPAYLLSWLFGLGFMAINIRWLSPVTLPGYIALAAYYSLFFPLAAWPIRHMHRRHGLSVAVTTALVWTATEYLRSLGDLGFPWLLLGHTQYRFLPLIQVSDLAGAYGVSFILAMVNGWLTDLVIQPILIWRSDQITRLPLGTASLAVVLIGALVYGWVQGGTAAMKPGPRIAVIQHDFPMYVDERAGWTSPESMYRAYFALAELAAAEKPDLIVLPETALSGYLNQEFLAAGAAELEEIRQRRFPTWSREGLVSMQNDGKEVRDSLQKLADKSQVPIVFGSLAIEWKPTSIPPRAEAYNSSFLIVPGKDRPVSRYDKNHLVMFGEYVPFRYSYHSMYQWLNSLAPWGGAEYSLDFGSGFTPFEFAAASQGGRRFRAGTPICYEEIMPYIGREFVRAGGPRNGKGIDMLLSISNDGWFLHSAELEQHLAAAVFRAVENRIGVARSVNTGASGFVQPNGLITDRVEFSHEQCERLGQVRSELVSLSEMAKELKTDGSQPNQSAEFIKRLGSLRARLTEMGKAFRFMDERLLNLAWGVSNRDATKQKKWVEALREQLASDIETVDRWCKRPGTAPGYRIAELKCDDRVTLYTRWGDWFSQGAVALSGTMILDWLLRRIWRTVASKE